MLSAAWRAIYKAAVSRDEEERAAMTQFIRDYINQHIEEDGLVDITELSMTTLSQLIPVLIELQREGYEKLYLDFTVRMSFSVGKKNEKPKAFR